MADPGPLLKKTARRRTPVGSRSLGPASVQHLPLTADKLMELTRPRAPSTCSLAPSFAHRSDSSSFFSFLPSVESPYVLVHTIPYIPRYCCQLSIQFQSRHPEEHGEASIRVPPTPIPDPFSTALLLRALRRTRVACA